MVPYVNTYQFLPVDIMHQFKNSFDGMFTLNQRFVPFLRKTKIRSGQKTKTSLA